MIPPSLAVWETVLLYVEEVSKETLFARAGFAVQFL